MKTDFPIHGDTVNGQIQHGTKFKPRVRAPGEATSYTINTFASNGNLYKPKPVLCARAGADAHLNCKSLGTPT